MNFYRKIEVANLAKLQQELLLLVPSELLKNPRVHFPKEQDGFFKIKELRDLLDNLGMSYNNTAFGYFVCAPKKSVPMHIDYGDTEYSLNIPLQHCDHTFTHFYKTDREPVLIPSRVHQGVAYHPHYSFVNVKAEIVESFESNIPCVMHIKTPHSVTNDTDNIRISTLIRHSNNDHMRSIFSAL